MTRIISGTHGGRRIQTPAGDNTRPTTDRVREALFSALQSQFGTRAGSTRDGGALEGLRFLDLFAGSGAIGLEALSRGAAAADLVEHDRKTAQLIKANVVGLGLEGARVVVSSVSRFVQQHPRTPYDVIFLDPPYAFDADALSDLLTVLAGPQWSTPESLFVVERAKRDVFAWPPLLEPVREKKYGETILWYGHCHG